MKGTHRNVAFYALVLVLILLNVYSLLGSRTPTGTRITEAYDSPRSGVIVPTRDYDSIQGRTIRIPSIDDRLTVLYFSGDDLLSIGQLASLETMANSSMSADVDFIWVRQNGAGDISPLEAKALTVLVVEQSEELLTHLGLKNPRPNSLSLLKANEVLFEGDFSSAFSTTQIRSLSGRSQLAPEELRPGASIHGNIRKGEESIALEASTRPTAVLLFGGFCGACGEDEIYRVLRSIATIDVYAVLPGNAGDSGIYSLVANVNANMGFYSLYAPGSSLSLDSFTFGHPVLVLIQSGKILYSQVEGSSGNRIEEMLRELAKMGEEGPRSPQHH